jgi:hypothetical protein
VKNRRVLALPLIALAVAVPACGPPNFAVQPNRQKFLQDKLDEDIKKALACESVQLHFQREEQRSGSWFDHYVVEGCGKRSEYITRLDQSGDWVTWGYGAVPPASQYKDAAEQQMMKTARFDLHCDVVELMELKSAIDLMQTSFRATIGARGCDKRTSYEVVCEHSGFVDGKHQVTCISQGSGAAQP